MKSLSIDLSRAGEFVLILGAGKREGSPQKEEGTV